MSQSNGEQTMNRRSFAKALGATSGIGIMAGCQSLTGGNNDSGSDSEANLGERVPQVAFTWGTYNGAYKDLAPTILKNLKNLGFNVKNEKRDIFTLFEEWYNDSRPGHLGLVGNSNDPARLDPSTMLMDFSIERAGKGGNQFPQYASCEYSDLTHAQRTASSNKKRKKLVNQAAAKFSEDYAVSPLLLNISVGAARKDQVNVKGMGDPLKIVTHNHDVMIRSEPTNGNALNVGVPSGMIETLDFLKITELSFQVKWSNIPNSPLFSYDPNLEHQGILARGYEVKDDGKRLDITLRDGGKFHDGSPIRPEDVKFTYNHFKKFQGSYPMSVDQGIESIDIVNDETVTFNFKKPNLAFVNNYATSVPILPQKKWEEMGAAANPDNFAMKAGDDWVGSGPFKVENFEPGRQVHLKPHSGHPHFPEPKHDLNWSGFDKTQPMIAAMIEGNVDLVWEMGQGDARRLRDELSKDEIMITTTKGFVVNYVFPIQSIAPGKFREFRKATGMVYNRQLMNAQDSNGESEPVLSATMFPETHPWHPSDDFLKPFTDDPEGDIEGAKQVLRDAGWGQDNNDDWHYPKDADLSPVWPKGSQPSAPEFPCMTKNGKYQGGSD